MTRLLVSVRSGEESSTAVRCGVDIVDLKEPLRGPLGCVGVRTAKWVGRTWGGLVPLSIALGELRHGSSARQQQYPMEAFQFAKVGLSGMSTLTWLGAWQRWQASLPATTQPVTVIYADWQTAASPEPTGLIQDGLDAGCRTFLVDTFNKAGGSLLDHVPPDQLNRWCTRIHARGGMLVAAGGLSTHLLPIVLETGVSVVAVRGGVCRAGRNSTLCPRRIKSWQQALHPDSLSVASCRSPQSGR